jgi:rhomboid protease GluP
MNDPVPRLGIQEIDAQDFAAATSERIAEPVNPLLDFRRSLSERTPWVFVTPAIVLANVVVFVVMVASGVSPVEPTIDSLIHWGGNYGPKTLNGEWWRLFTSMFIHIGIFHIAMNMWAFWAAGLLVERLVGNVGFFVLYTLSGLAGSMASLYWHPMLVSAGASGAIFGVFGALLATLLKGSGSIPTQALTRLRNSAIAFVGYNLVFGFFVPQIDMAAHIGGLVAGFLCGLALGQPAEGGAGFTYFVRTCGVAGMGTVAMVALGLLLPHNVPDVYGEMEAFAKMEKQALATYNSAVVRVQQHQLSEAQLADVVEKEVLPKWSAATQRFTSMKVGTAALPKFPIFVQYLRARQNTWELLVQGVRENNPQKMAESKTQASLAEQYVRQLLDASKVGK